MKFQSKAIRLKDGTAALLRSPMPEDAQAMLSYLRKTSAETDFLLRYPEECTMTPDQEEAYLRNTLQNPDAVMILCEVEGKIAGNCSLSRHNWMKTRHRASIGIALIRDFWSLGIGSAMFAEIYDLAKAWGIEQLELEVFGDNCRAMALYKRQGFQIVAEHPNAIKRRDGTYISEYLMVKPLTYTKN